MSSATWSHHIASLATQLVAGDRNSTEISSLNFLRKNGKTFTYIGAKKKINKYCYHVTKKTKGKERGKGCPSSASMFNHGARATPKTAISPGGPGHSLNLTRPPYGLSSPAGRCDASRSTSYCGTRVPAGPRNLWRARSSMEAEVQIIEVGERTARRLLRLLLHASPSEKTSIIASGGHALVP
jgi:hypothetical protein